MTAPIRYTRRALGRLQHIGEWIAKDNPAAADQVVARITSAIDLLRDHPDIGRPGRLAGTRELVLTDIPYIVPYRVTKGYVEIITIMHTSQRWPDRL